MTESLYPRDCASPAALLQVERLGRATPWLLPPSLHLPYEGFHNDLPALLRWGRCGL